jgi:trk system potassium uptake protein TrkH
VRLTLDTKLVLVTTAGLIVFGTIGFMLTEWNNSRTLGSMGPGSQLMNAMFMATSRTAGFASVDMAAITESGLILMMALMFVGGSSGSTAGGIKVQTFSILFCAIVSTVRGTEEVEAFGRRVPLPYVFRALAVALLSVASIFLAFFLLNATESAGSLGVMFETISAFATVGLSTGITPDTSEMGRVILIVAMFTGRLGPLTLVLALASREHARTYHRPEEGVRIG